MDYTHVSYEAACSVYGSINMLYVHVFPTAGAIRDPLATAESFSCLSPASRISLPGNRIVTS